MADLQVEFAGLKFRNPILTAAGPTSRDGMTLLTAATGGVGGLVAKTISVKGAQIPRPNMAAIGRGRVSSRRGILNTELWSELPPEQWFEKEYAIAKSSGLTLVASVGYTPEEVSSLAPEMERAGVEAIEFSTHYVGGHVEIAKALRDSVNIPIFAKLSPKVDVAKVAKSLEPHVDGIVAINTYGPCLRIDIETARPMLGGEGGQGWLSGPALKPIALRCVADIAQAVDLPIMGVGGVTSGEDVIEFVMAGASAVQVCTAAILEGHTIYGKIVDETKKWLDTHGYGSINEIRGIALKQLTELTPPPSIDHEKCTVCGLCVKSCVYDAITANKEDGILQINSEDCQACGMCISVCPFAALGYE